MNDDVTLSIRQMEGAWQMMCAEHRWIVKPGSDLYFVYNQNWVDNPLENRFDTLDRRAASKVLYTHRF